MLYIKNNWIITELFKAIVDCKLKLWSDSILFESLDGEDYCVSLFMDQTAVCCFILGHLQLINGFIYYRTIKIMNRKINKKAEKQFGFYSQLSIGI